MHVVKLKLFLVFDMNKHDEVPNKPTKRHPRRVPLWLPYLQSIREGPKNIFTFTYNGGSESVPLNHIQSILVYGESSIPLNIAILERFARAGVPIVIHRRNLAQPVYVFGGLRPDAEDTLARQLILRSHSQNTRHIARQLLLAKFKACAWLVAPEPLPPYTDVAKLRSIEAKHAKRYWTAYFKILGHPEYSRRGDNPARAALDASSKFVSGIQLRWITYHHLSPYHGFLHEPTDYPSLVYDLMEPYRGTFERVLLETWAKEQIPAEQWLPSGIAALKLALNERVYTGLTRQIVTRQELLHGVVLSLKHYLLGKQRKFLIPMENKPNGGRPPKVAFLLYGRHAGRTDFWSEARRIAL